MRTSRATLALALLVASAAVVSAVTPTYSTFTVKAGYDRSETNVGTDATVDGYTGAVCTWCTSSRLPITSLPAFHACTFPSIADLPRVFPSLVSVEVVPSCAGEGVTRARSRAVRRSANSFASPFPNFRSGSTPPVNTTRRSQVAYELARLSCSQPCVVSRMSPPCSCALAMPKRPPLNNKRAAPRSIHNIQTLTTSGRSVKWRSTTAHSSMMKTSVRTSGNGQHIFDKMEFFMEAGCLCVPDIYQRDTAFFDEVVSAAASCAGSNGAVKTAVKVDATIHGSGFGTCPPRRCPSTASRL